MNHHHHHHHHSGSSVLVTVLGILALVAFAYNARDLAKWIKLERM